MPAGEVRVGVVACRDQLLAGGEGDRSDLILANSRFRAVLRHPTAALTVPGLGGGTVIDAAPWGRGDRLHEIIPLVGGGWLRVDDFSVAPDGVVLHGEVRSLPDQPADAVGERRTVAWRVVPDDPWLHLEGADGLWLHPSDAMEVLDGWLVSERHVYGHDGQVQVDLGGALRVHGASRLLIASPGDAWAERPGPLQRVAGRAPDASTVDVLRGDEPIARLPVVDGAFAATVPDNADGLRATAVGRAPSPTVSPGEDALLELGPFGLLRLRLAWADGVVPRPVRVTWQGTGGRSGTGRLGPSGGELALGSGTFQITLSSGPHVRPVALRVEVAGGGTVDLPVRLRAGVAPPHHVLADLGWQGSRSRHVRENALDRSRDAVADGLGFIVSTAEDDVDTPSAYLDDVPWLRWDGGTTLTSPGGWAVGSWPWRASSGLAGHGAPWAAPLTPVEALRVSWGGEAVDRTTRVDLAWMEAIDVPPWAVDPAPDLVVLGPPGSDLAAWAPWFRWLDAGRAVLPSGPLHWVDVGDANAYGAFDVAQGLARGRLSAGTGAWVDVAVDGVGPGGVVPAAEGDTGDTRSDGPREVLLTLDRGALPLDRLTLVSDGEPLGTFEIARDRWDGIAQVPLGRWTVAVAWSTTSDDWAVTAPLWLAGAPPSDAAL